MKLIHRQALRYLIAAVLIAGVWAVAPAGQSGWEGTQWNSGVKIKQTSNGFMFNFPTGNGHINSVERDQGAIPFKATVAFQCLVKTLTGNPKIVGLDNSPGLAPNCRVMIQRKGDDWTCSGGTENYRWWSTGALCVFLKPDGKTYTYSVKFTPENWTNCWGKPASQNKGAFKSALSNADNVQIVFGGGNSFSHGLTSKNGTAQFQLLSFNIQ